VAGRSGAGYHLIDPDDVLAFQAEREIVWIITANRERIVNRARQRIDERLRGFAFQRVHHNALVNVNHVKSNEAVWPGPRSGSIHQTGANTPNA